ncbi:MAG: hypothetical protein FWD33_01320 [Alphaproteobacteria bacterium]|nr:hypothetical protein [Alphaproteobacteria bacterium]
MTDSYEGKYVSFTYGLDDSDAIARKYYGDHYGKFPNWLLAARTCDFHRSSYAKRAEEILQIQVLRVAKESFTDRGITRQPIHDPESLFFSCRIKTARGLSAWHGIGALDLEDRDFAVDAVFCAANYISESYDVYNALVSSISDPDYPEGEKHISKEIQVQELVGILKEAIR